MQKVKDFLIDNLSWSKIKEFGKEHPILTAFAALEAFILAKKTLKGVSFLYETFLRPRKNFKKEYGGEWAIITGASQGLGRSYCHELAKEGYNLIVSARTQEDLAKLGEEISAKYGVNVKTLPFDFNTPFSEAAYFPILNTIEDLDISILINNVAVGFPVEFDKVTEEVIQRFINVNIISTVFMTRILLPQILNRPKKSAIINISSVAEFGKLPYMQLYSGTKAFVVAFTRALAIEYEKRVDFLCIIPGAMYTKMLPYKFFYSTSTDEAAKAQLDRLGYENESCGHWKHYLQRYLFHNVPQYLLNKRGEMFLRRFKERQENEAHTDE